MTIKHRFEPARGDLVEIEWEDNFTERAGWYDVDMTPVPSAIKSVGYVVAVTPKLIMLAPTFDIREKMVSGSMGRLRSGITKGTILRRGTIDL